MLVVTVYTSRLFLGCIADDFTGASDAASFLVKEGVQTVLVNGVPEADIDLQDCQAVVIALKTRSIERERAVHDTLSALRWLERKRVRQFYIKYCSTFDSTPQGNIGPVVDMVMQEYQEKYTILCPALPVNKRIVKDGILMVDGVPLAESPMKDHPLNPMWSSSIAELMKPQGQYGSIVVSAKMLEEQSPAELQKLMSDFGKDKEHFYVISDYINEDHANKIVAAFGNLKVMTGGSGLLSQLALKYKKELSDEKTSLIKNGTKGRGIILAGSCSQATLEQIAVFQQQGGKTFKIDPLQLLQGKQSEEEIWKFVIEHQDESVLLYSSDKADNIKEIQKHGREKIAVLLETTLSNLSRRAIAQGIKRIIVAGGETSGAVALALDFHAFFIGESIAPGVPIMVPLKNQDIRLVLKSGNFGQKDFFSRALIMTKD